MCLARDLQRGIHGSVAAGVEKAANVLLLEDFENAAVVFLRKLEATGAEGGTGRSCDCTHQVLILSEQLRKVFFEEPLNAEASAIQMRESSTSARFLYETNETRVDYRRGSAAMGDE